MFAYDVVGFQTAGDATNFQRYVLEQAGGILKAGGQISAFGRTIVARDFPIGIDVDSFKQMAHTAEAEAQIRLLSQRTLHRAQIIGDNELRIRLGGTHHLAQYQAKAEARGEALEAAIMLGPPPELVLAAAAPTRTSQRPGRQARSSLASSASMVRRLKSAARGGLPTVPNCSVTCPSS